MKAREIIRDALTFHLNRLSPGEAEDADTFNTCLRALNSIVDEFNGVKSFLFREVLTTSSTISAASAALGTAWTGLVAGDEILGATVQIGGIDVMLDAYTMEQYQAIATKTQTGDPQYYAHDGQATVYFYPVPTGHAVTLRTKQVVADFADLDTEYTAPKGYQSAMSAILAELLAPSMIGGLTPAIASKAKSARDRLVAQNMNPAILGQTGRAWNIQTGWA